MKSVFLDTVGLIGLWDEGDQWHLLAAAAMAELRKSPCRMLTTSFVMLECGNTASRTTYRREVAQLRQEFADYGNLIIPTEEDERRAWAA